MRLKRDCLLWHRCCLSVVVTASPAARPPSPPSMLPAPYCWGYVGLCSAGPGRDSNPAAPPIGPVVSLGGYCAPPPSRPSAAWHRRPGASLLPAPPGRPLLLPSRHYGQLVVPRPVPSRWSLAVPFAAGLPRSCLCGRPTVASPAGRRADGRYRAAPAP